MKHTHKIGLLAGAALALALSACASDDDSSGGGATGSNTGSKPRSTSSATTSATAGAAAAGSGSSNERANAGGKGGTAAPATGSISRPDPNGDFDVCHAALEHCVAREMDTAEKMEMACRSQEAIAVPLSDGTMYGPKTIQSGPYGGTIDWNAGAGTEYVNPVNSLEPVCLPLGVQTFNEPKSVNDELLNTRSLDYSLYTVFRPACMKPGEKYPVITWANGTCGLTHGYAGLLGSLASHGFVIIASNSTWTGTNPTNKVQLRALDYAKALHEDPNSVLHQRLDLDKIGAMGHSQGSGATSTASTDPRIKALILWNGGVSNNKPFLYVSGERDVGTSVTPMTMAQRTADATKPGAWIYYKQVLVTGGTATGHLVLMEQPERVIDMTIAWWKYILNGDEEAKKMFLGDDCGLCNKKDEFEFGHNSMLQ